MKAHPQDDVVTTQARSQAPTDPVERTADHDEEQEKP
jgi:hypothetical protein